MSDRIRSTPARVPLTAMSLGALLLLAAAAVPAQGVAEMLVGQAREATLRGEMVLVDIRTPQEWRETGIPDVAVPLDMQEKGFLQALLALRGENPGRRLGFICATGGRSRYLATLLVRNGISDVVDVNAGMMTRDGWLAHRLPVRAPGQPMPAGAPGASR